MAFIQVDPFFSDHLLYLAGTAMAAANGTQLSGQAVWYRPFLRGWSGNPLDLKGMQAAFDRSSLNALYQAGLLQPAYKATVGDMMAAKLQIDYTSGLERAFRTRHATRIRCVAHNMARKKGHGHGGGLFLGTVLTHIQNVVSAATPPSSDDTAGEGELGIVGDGGDQAPMLTE